MTFYRRMLFAGRIVQKRHVNPLAQNSRELNSFTSFFYFNILFDVPVSVTHGGSLLQYENIERIEQVQKHYLKNKVS
ncbi:MAG: hypothetical protein ACI8RD_010118 [Bacillariaceae sp.]|jgi:hypothetical protein